MSLSSGYRQLEYIESSGTQFIDTGISVGPDNASALKSVIDKMILTTNAYALDGTGYGAAPYNNSFYLGTDANRNIAYGDGRADKTTSTAYDGSRRTFVYDAQNGKVSVSNLTEISFTFSAPDTALNFLLFAYNQGTQGGVKYYSGRIYGAKLYINGILVRDFVPCVNASSEVGLWDDVNSVFYGNAGTGTFTAGPVVDPYGNDENTLLLLHGEDLADSGPYNKSITNNGVSISDAQSKFGRKSLYFNGSSNLSIDLPVTGDMTVDFWAYIQDSSISFPTPFGWDYNGNRCNYVHTKPSVTWFAQNDGRDSIEVNTNGIAHNAWHHIALVRSGKQMLGFIDGVLKTTSSVNYGNNDILSIGVLNAAKSATWFTGFIDEFRVSSIARWTVDFTPPSKPYSSSLNLPVNIGGTWKDANEVFVNIGGTWKSVKAAYVNIGGTWKELG